MKVKYLIVGAGIGGLAAGAELKRIGIEDFMIVDMNASLPLNLSNGVHYLHSNDFGTPFPFELKKIECVEEIWDPRKDTFKKVSCVPEMMDYSMKVMGVRHPSSISDPGNRSWKTFLPESNDMNDLILGYYNYIGKEHFLWWHELDAINEELKYAIFINKEEVNIQYEHLITTAPMNTFMNCCKDFEAPVLRHQPIFIVNYKTENIVSNWLISLYISDPQFPPYRITILNNIISMESVKEMTATDEAIVWYHLSRYFDYSIDSASKHEWKTGRIFGLAKADREKIISDFEKMNIHLLGRFSRWDGKLLLDSTILQAKEIIKKII